MYVPATDDPNKKLDQAYELIQHQERPLPAEKLIRESIENFERENDLKGLAKAYWTYGVFFQSNAVNKLSQTYKKNGFLLNSATYENRYEIAIQFFNKAESIAKKDKDYEFLANISWNKASNYEMRGNLDQACKEYRRSLESNRKRNIENPDSDYFIPGTGYVSFKEYEQIFIEYMKSLDCH